MSVLLNCEWLGIFLTSSRIGANSSQCVHLNTSILFHRNYQLSDFCVSSSRHFGWSFYNFKDRPVDTNPHKANCLHTEIDNKEIVADYRAHASIEILKKLNRPILTTLNLYFDFIVSTTNSMETFFFTGIRNAGLFCWENEENEKNEEKQETNLKK